MYPELAKRLSSRAKRDEPLAKHTTFRVGGPADFLIDVETKDELRFVLDLARREDVPLRVIGGGSNVLVRDAGVRGVVARLSGEFHAVALDEKTNMLRAGAGASVAAVCAEAISRGFNNFCWTAGIPGTMGGALIGNAGAWGHDVGEFVEYVHVMTRLGEERTLTNAACVSSMPPASAGGGGGAPRDFSLSPKGGEGRGEGAQPPVAAGGMVEFSYRHAEFPEPGLIVLGATLRLANIDAPIADPNLLCRDYIDRKRRTQPLEHPSAGSVFKNPAPDKPAGLLIDRAGCKGLRIEGACVSPKHANFIVNDRHATATDVTQLIDAVRSRVKESSGITLDLEIQVW